VFLLTRSFRKKTKNLKIRLKKYFFLNNLQASYFVKEYLHALPHLLRLSKDLDDIFSKDGPSGLSPFRGIEHQIDLVPRASLPIDRLIELILKKLRR